MDFSEFTNASGKNEMYDEFEEQISDIDELTDFVFSMQIIEPFGSCGMKEFEMKKNFPAVVILSLILAVTGCSRANSINQSKASNDQAAEILRCLDEEDIEGLKSMFCEDVASSHDLDEEIAEAMEFYKGKSVSFSSISLGGGDSMEDGELTDSHIGYSIRGVETDQDATYKIVTHSYLVYKENPKFIGITYITIIDTETDARVELGEYVK